MNDQLGTDEEFGEWIDEHIKLRDSLYRSIEASQECINNARGFIRTLERQRMRRLGIASAPDFDENGS